MTKWLWYINATLIFLALLVFVIGLSQLADYSTQAADAKGKDGVSGKNGQSENGTTASSASDDSPLVVAIREYSRRWQPKPKPEPKVEPKPKPDEVVKAEPKPPPPPPPPLELSSLVVNIEPSEVIKNGAQWKVGDKPWTNSGELAEEIKVGSYKISFKPVTGWNVPASQTVEIVKDEAALATATYTRTKPAGPNFTLQGTIIMGPDDGVALLNLPNEKKDKAFFVGETIEKYTLTKVGDGKVVLTRDGYEYPLVVAKAAKEPEKPTKESTSRKSVPPSRKVIKRDEIRQERKR